jgi:hypothetical protein
MSQVSIQDAEQLAALAMEIINGSKMFNDSAVIKEMKSLAKTRFALKDWVWESPGWVCVLYGPRGPRGLWGPLGPYIEPAPRMSHTQDLPSP